MAASLCLVIIFARAVFDYLVQPSFATRVRHNVGEATGARNRANVDPSLHDLVTHANNGSDPDHSSLAQNTSSSQTKSPRLEISTSILFSKRLHKPSIVGKLRTQLSRPCVVFFPGDVSDLSSNVRQPKGWSLEDIHKIVAERFPTYDVLTIRGELIGNQRSFKDFVQDPPRAIEHLQDLLGTVQATPANVPEILRSQIILIGFSKGGLGPTVLINGAESDPGFWRRVKAIHYIDVGGPDGFVKDQNALQVLAQSNKKIKFNFQLTKYPPCAAMENERKLMMSLLNNVGLSFTTAEFPVESFEEHMRFLQYFHV